MDDNRKPKKRISQVESDQILTREYTKDFDWKNSEAWKFLQRHFGTKLNHADLTRLAELCLLHLKEVEPTLYFPREAARRKIPLVRWFNDNIDIIMPFITRNVVVQRLDGQLVGCDEAKECVSQWQGDVRACPVTDEPPGHANAPAFLELTEHDSEDDEDQNPMEA